MLTILAVSLALFGLFYALAANDVSEPHGFGTDRFMWYFSGVALSAVVAFIAGIALLIG